MGRCTIISYLTHRGEYSFMHDISILDLIRDEELRELLLEWLKPTEAINDEIKMVSDGTVLEGKYMTGEQRGNHLILKYYLEEPIDSYELEKIYNKQDVLNTLTFPFVVEIEVYEPRLVMKLSQEEKEGATSW